MVEEWQGRPEGNFALPPPCQHSAELGQACGEGLLHAHCACKLHKIRKHSLQTRATPLALKPSPSALCRPSQHSKPCLQTCRPKHMIEVRLWDRAVLVQHCRCRRLLPPPPQRGRKPSMRASHPVRSTCRRRRPGGPAGAHECGGLSPDGGSAQRAGAGLQSGARPGGPTRRDVARAPLPSGGPAAGGGGGRRRGARGASEHHAAGGGAAAVQHEHKRVPAAAGVGAGARGGAARAPRGPRLRHHRRQHARPGGALECVRCCWPRCSA